MATIEGMQEKKLGGGALSEVEETQEKRWGNCFE